MGRGEWVPFGGDENVLESGWDGCTTWRTAEFYDGERYGLCTASHVTRGEKAKETMKGGARALRPWGQGLRTTGSTSHSRCSVTWLLTFSAGEAPCPRTLLAQGLPGQAPGREGGDWERRRLCGVWAGDRNKEAGGRPGWQGTVWPHPQWEKHSPRKPSSSTMMV